MGVSMTQKQREREREREREKEREREREYLPLKCNLHWVNTRHNYFFTLDRKIRPLVNHPNESKYWRFPQSHMHWIVCFCNAEFLQKYFLPHWDIFYWLLICPKWHNDIDDCKKNQFPNQCFQITWREWVEGDVNDWILYWELKNSTF